MPRPTQLPATTKGRAPPKGGMRFEALLSRLSACFIHAPAGEVDAHVESALSQAVAFLGVERGSIAQFSADGSSLIVTHSYTIPGFEPMPPVDLARMWPWYTARVREGTILRFSRLPEEAPPEASVEAAFIRKSGGPRSHLMIPFWVGESVLGGLGFGTFGREVEWPDSVVTRMRLVGEILANAVGRKRTLENEALLREQLQARSGSVEDLESLRMRAAGLTPREREVMELVAAGMPNKRAAARLGVCEKTIKAHRAKVMRKMHASSLAELVRMSDRLGQTARL